MKKMTFAVIAALILALALPTAAAPIQFGGSVESKMEWDGENIAAQNDVELNMGLSAGGGDRVKAVIGLAPWSIEGSQILGKDNKYDVAHDLRINSIYVEAHGAYWNGGPEVTTRLGDLTLGYNPYIATLNREGISVEGLQLAGTRIGGFYAWDNGTPIQGLRVARSLFGVDGSMTLVNGRNANAYAVNAAFKPHNRVSVNSVYAGTFTGRDLAQRAEGFRVDTTTKVADNLTVTAGFRSFDPAFAPEYAQASTDTFTSPYDANRGRTGFHAGALTEVAGVAVAAGYDQHVKVEPNGAKTQNQTATLNASTNLSGLGIAAGTKWDFVASNLAETTLSLDRAIPVVDGINLHGSYDLKLVAGAEAAHTIKTVASTNLVPQLQNLGVEAELGYMGSITKADIAATYAAPNGMSIKGSYDILNNAPGLQASMKVTF